MAESKGRAEAMDDIKLLQRIGWLERKVTQLLRIAIAAVATLLAWPITAFFFPGPWDFISWGTGLTIFVVLSVGLHWLEFRDAPAHLIV
jgi:hypothetical protein